MTKQEVKDAAKALGMKVRENFMDDATENLIILIVGMCIGGAIVKFWL